MEENAFTHIDEKGNAKMVDVSQKAPTLREAVAVGRVIMNKVTLEKILDSSIPKGDVLATARIAGIMAAKKTQDIIPMCHNIPIESIKLDLECDLHNNSILINAVVKCFAKTGVEMECLTAVSVAALTVYDMCKAVDKNMTISDIMLIKKTGGKSGNYERGNT